MSFPARYALQDLNNLNVKMLKLGKWGLISLSCKRRGCTKLANLSGIQQGHPLKWKECGSCVSWYKYRTELSLWNKLLNIEKGPFKNIYIKLSAYNLLYINNIIAWMWFFNLNHYFIPYLCSKWDPSSSLKSNLQMRIILRIQNNTISQLHGVKSMQEHYRGYLNTVM